jgi:hypothetical protein
MEFSIMKNAWLFFNLLSLSLVIAVNIVIVGGMIITLSQLKVGA